MEETHLMSIRSIGARSTATRSAVTFALALAAVGGLATSSTGATTTTAQPAMSLSSASGKEIGTNAITATTTVNKFYSGKTYVQFQLTTSLTGNCQTTYTATAANSVINATSTAIISTKKISVVVPVLTAASGAGTTQTWLVCAYAGNTAGTSKLLAKAGYTSAGAPTLTALSADVQLPTYGGTTINVVGTGFAAGVNSATLGGKALTDINVVDDTLFTATVPTNPVGDAALTVNTVGGTATILSTATNAYTYVDAIQVSPTTGVSGTSVPLSVQGYGFNNLTFTTSLGEGPKTDDSGTHVYLVAPWSGATKGYDATANVANKTKPQKNECTGIQVISDTELVCTLDLNKSSHATTIDTALTGTATAVGAYQVSVVTDGRVAGGAAQALTAGSIFTVSPF
jgi:hypothetical protein